MDIMKEIALMVLNGKSFLKFWDNQKYLKTKLERLDSIFEIEFREKSTDEECLEYYRNRKHRYKFNTTERDSSKYFIILESKKKLIATSKSLYGEKQLAFECFLKDPNAYNLY
jgi:hypothetical protein